MTIVKILFAVIVAALLQSGTDALVWNMGRRPGFGLRPTNGHEKDAESVLHLNKWEESGRGRFDSGSGEAARLDGPDCALNKRVRNTGDFASVAARNGV